MRYNITRFLSGCLSSSTNINIVFTFARTNYIVRVSRTNRNCTSPGIHRCLSSTNHSHYSTSKCGQFNDLFRFGFTLSMPKFRNCCPRLCSMIPNNFKHFVHKFYSFLLGLLRSCCTDNSTKKFSIKKVATTNLANSFPYPSGQNSLF